MEQVLPNSHIQREQCIQECLGCGKMFSDENIGNVCIAYVNPKAIHRIGCALQTNKKEESVVKKKVNPLKASKRARRKGR